MSLGTGIFASTVLVLLVWVIWQISRKQKWKLLGKIFGVIFIAGIVLGAGIWAVVSYIERPKITNEYDGLRLGMRAVDVTVAKGEPKRFFEPEFNESVGKYRSILIFQKEYSDKVLIAVLGGDSPENQIVYRICQSGGYGKLLNINIGASEDQIFAKLGEPSKESISEDGFKKILSFANWKASFTVIEGNVDTICISTTGSRSFETEYGDSQKLSEN